MNDKPVIMIVDDDPNIVQLIRLYLTRDGYDAVSYGRGDEALAAFKQDPPSLLILDIMMPHVSGLEVCKAMRAENSNLGIIMLTAKTQEMDKITGLMVGADDYVTKPFSPSELMARVDAIYRRVSMNKAHVEKPQDSSYILTSGIFSLNLRNRTLTKNGRLIQLTQVEFQIMEYFLSNQGAALDRDDILARVWGENYFGEDKVVDVNIRRLRMKIEDVPSNPVHLTTVWGMGYKWVP